MPSAPLVETKLFAPGSRAGLVQRSRLFERLDAGLDSKLIVVSASAGSGKTTLLGEWLGASDTRRAAWLSLDPSDNDPGLFWSYFFAALYTGFDGGRSPIPNVRFSERPEVQTLLGILINQISAVAGRVALVLDDYHVIEHQPIHDGIAYLLDHLPAQMQLIIASRSDPPLPLARLRARGELTEIRASHLRFTSDEAATFLNEMMGLQLTGADVATLEARTEGWIAGLQLAALSMQGRGDTASFIAALSGDDRYIVDYLVGIDRVGTVRREEPT